MVTVFTIGHSNHPLERFIELLARHRIEVLADIRRFPGSRKHPHFNRESLAAALTAKSIVYEWIEELGGRRKAPAGIVSPNQGLRNESFRNYADYMLTLEFQQSIDKLLAIAAQRSTAIMCAEGLWWQCHRRLVSDYLVANGVSVEHIFPNAQTKPHAMTPEARSAGGRVVYPAVRTLFEGDDSIP
jgi:uncharacterized protein (DUF488 family)